MWNATILRAEHIILSQTSYYSLTNNSRLREY